MGCGQRDRDRGGAVGGDRGAGGRGAPPAGRARRTRSGGVGSVRRAIAGPAATPLAHSALAASERSPWCSGRWRSSGWRPPPPPANRAIEDRRGRRGCASARSPRSRPVPAIRRSHSQAPRRSAPEGPQLYQNGCSSCHGVALQGTPGVAPSLIGVGAGPVDFYLSTGRMPLASSARGAAAKRAALQRQADRRPDRLRRARSADRRRRPPTRRRATSRSDCSSSRSTAPAVTRSSAAAG